MSNKDVRRPAPGAADDFWKQRKADILDVINQYNNGEIPIRDVSEPENKGGPKPDAKPAPDPDEELLAHISPEKREEWATQGREIERRLCRQFNAGQGEIDDDEALSALDVCTRFLKQLVSLASAVLETVDVQSVRAIVAAESSLPRGMVLTLKAAGIEVGDPSSTSGQGAAGAKEAQSSDHRKRPRGSRHPLMVLVNFGLQASRLIQKITAGTNPGSQNLKKKTDGGGAVPGVPGIPKVPGM